MIRNFVVAARKMIVAMSILFVISLAYVGCENPAPTHVDRALDKIGYGRDSFGVCFAFLSSINSYGTVVSIAYVPDGECPVPRRNVVQLK